MNHALFESSIEDIAKGYHTDGHHHTCLICCESYEIGQIYAHEEKLYDAKARMEKHIREEHGGMLSYLLHCNPDLLGISELQQEMLQHFASQKTDKDIAQEQGIALSTIRSYRYKLREKQKQARLFLAMMELLEKQTEQPVRKMQDDILVDAPITATTLDERFNITAAEKEKYLKQYFDETGHLREYPARAKRKVIVLEAIASQFKKDVSYSETEVNRILKRIYDDHVSLRRALIEYGFLDRSDDGSKYWVKL